MNFPPMEIAEFVVASVLLTAMFLVAYNWPIAVAFGIGGLGLMLHELGHKVVGRYRCINNTDFVIMPIGIIIGFITSFVGMTLAAPGGVTVGKNASKEDQLWMALAGPATNVLVFGVFGILAQVAEVHMAVGSVTIPLFWSIALVNLYLALFNILPIPLFDGNHIFRLDKVVWGTSFGLILLLTFIFGGGFGDVLSPLFAQIRPHVRSIWGAIGVPLYPGLMLFREQTSKVSSIIAHSVSDSRMVELG